MGFTVTDLITSLKRKATIPAVQSLFSNADLAALLDEQLQTYIVPFIMSCREEYFVTYIDYTVDTTTNSYPIPSKAIGGKIKDVCWLLNDDEILSIPMLNNDTMSQYNGLYYKANGFYIQNYAIKLYPADQQTPSTNTLRVYYYKRPNTLMENTTFKNWGIVGSLETGKIVLTTTVPAPSVDGTATTWSTSTILDVISKNPRFDNVLSDITISNVDTGTFKLTVSSNTGVSVGDYVCSAGEAAVPQYIPVEFHVMLVQAAANNIFRTLGDQKSYEFGLKTLEGMEQSMIKLISPRVDNEAKKITGKSLMNNGRRRY